MNVNRKYITSTGLLLKTLSEENQNQIYHNESLYNNTQYNLINQPPPSFISDTNRFAKKPQNYYNTVNKNVSQQQLSNYSSQPPQSSSTTINYKSISNKGSSSYDQISNSSSSISLSSSTTTVADLPETFGLPLNRQKKSVTKYSSINASNTSTNLSNTTLNSTQQQQQQQQNVINSTNSDIQIININKSTNNLGESISAPTLSTPTNKQQQDNEIEIISENFTSTVKNKNLTSGVLNNKVQNKNLSLNTSNITTDEKMFKEYLSKNYNMDLSIACKPQCNFVSNVSCIDQCIQQSNYYENYLKKQQSFNKRIKINSLSSDNDDRNSSYAINKIKKQKLIVIDDTEEGGSSSGGGGGGSDEAQKPWITPQLINLIKQRNLLQSKLNEQEKEPDPELMAKFKNLRNKVTKLVKNARKEYLGKIIKEKKEKEAAAAGGKGNIVDSTTTSKSITNITDQTSITSTTINSTHTPSASSSTISISSNQSAYMINLYNTFFNQYMQNYAQQKLPESTTSVNDDIGAEYDSLQKQAAYYAQQQQSIQKQLDACLASVSQQYLKDIPQTTSLSSTTVPTQAPPPPPPQQQQQQQNLPPPPHIPYNMNYYNLVN